MPHPLPDASCYRVPVNGYLLAGLYPGDLDRGEAIAKLHSFRGAGITFFVDLTEEGELYPYSTLVPEVWPSDERQPIHRRMPIRDVNIPKHPDHMHEILDVLDAALTGGHRVYVHCWGGVGRTGTVVGAYLVRHGLDGSAALAEVQRLYDGSPKAKVKRRESPETYLQKQYVLGWAAEEAKRKNGGAG